MATNDRQAREERARLRTYQARQQVHAGKKRRRVRDNVIASIALVIVLALAVGAQLFFFTGGPGAPEPVASETPTPTPEAAEVPLARPRRGPHVDRLARPQRHPARRRARWRRRPAGRGQRPSASSRRGSTTGSACHRLTKDGIWVLQCGDPNGDGTGGPGYSYGPVENAPADGVYPAGTIAMARQPAERLQPGQPVLHRLRRHDAARRRRRRLHRHRAGHERPRRAARRGRPTRGRPAAHPTERRACRRRSRRSRSSRRPRRSPTVQ